MTGVQTCALPILAQMAQFLASVGAISFENLFVDGTKIEAVAGKYTFVWKKGVAKNRTKLMEKLDTFLAGVEKEFGIHLRRGSEIRPKDWDFKLDYTYDHNAQETNESAVQYRAGQVWFNPVPWIEDGNPVYVDREGNRTNTDGKPAYGSPLQTLWCAVNCARRKTAITTSMNKPVENSLRIGFNTG